MAVAATALVVTTMFGATGCRARNDRTASVAEPSTVATDAGDIADEPTGAPVGSTTADTAPATPVETKAVSSASTAISDEDIGDLERQLDEIDRLLTDAERDFDED